MGVLLPNYPGENVVKGENVPNFKINTSKGASSNVFQILQDLQLKQCEGQYHLSTVLSTTLKQYGGQYHLSTVPSTTSMKSNTVQVPCTSTQENPQVPPTQYRTQHNQLLLLGTPNPPQL